MAKVICNLRQSCKHRQECGGAKPHQYDPNECGRCPMGKESICLPCPEEAIANHINTTYEKE